jgi:ATP-dependent helicase HrpA
MPPHLNITAHLDPSLPVIQRKDEIIATIAQHQVVVLAGETGSGKTTQLPKLAMLAGRGKLGRIALTQPRRLAARAVANRLAEELDTSVGQGVGVKIRFHQQIADHTVIKVLTDGMLLAEIQQSALLTEYDTIIVDEAHERSLNIDFLLGYLRQLKDKRPDLKIIVTSATIDLERFSEFFDGAPIISVTGRTYPVEVRYRPLTELGHDDEDASDDLDMNTAIVRAVEELTQSDPFGDILVFLAGESDIRDATEALRLAGLKHTEILPLYARQSYQDQQKIFTTGGQRRIVLSTNVAETSLTVPGIRHVIDTGLARIKRYSPRNKVQRLPIEAISQASANQRKGRCGRVAEWICIRLYGEADFLGRPAFTEAEMQRSNLASVILQMQSLGFGQLENFPLIDPPPSRLITALRNLHF